MTNRRQFLQSGAAVSAFAVNGLVPGGAAAIGASGAMLAPRRVIFDDRYAAARVFAAAVAARGVAVGAVEGGDVTRWYEELDLEWRTRPTALAGTTQFGPMFVLERLGAERGLRLALRVEHRPLADGTLSHEVSGDAPGVALARGLFEAGVEWPLLMAALLCGGATLDGASRGNTVLADASAAPRLEEGARAQPSIIHYYTPRAVQQGYGEPVDGPLFSWLLVPRSA
jgi:hypothetical protein